MTVPYRPFAVRLADRERIGASFVRMTLTGDDLADCSPTLLDQRVKLLLGGDLAAMTASADWYATWRSLPDDQRPALRTYTLSAVRPEHHEVDIDVVIHEPASGPALAFAANAPLGSELVLVAGDRTAEGHDEVGVAWHPGQAREVLVVGDETALPAITNIARELDDDITGRIVVEVPTPADRRSLGEPDGVEVVWCARADGEDVWKGLPFRRSGIADESDPDELLWDEGPGADRYAWVAGEAGWVRQIRLAALNHGFDKGACSFMGYWKQGSVVH